MSSSTGEDSAWPADDRLEPVLEHADSADWYDRRQIEPATEGTENAKNNERCGHHPRRLAKMPALAITGAVRSVERVDHHSRHVDRGEQRRRDPEEVHDIQDC